MKLPKVPYLEQPFPLRLFSRFFKHDVGRCAAALAFYLLFSFFPALILLSVALSFLRLPPLSVSALRGLVPQEVLQVMTSYLQHVQALSSASGVQRGTLVVGSTVLMVYFTMRAMNCLLRSVRRAYHYRDRNSKLVQQRNLLLSTLGLMLGAFLALALVNAGRGLLYALAPALGLDARQIETWNGLRFLLLAIVLFVVLLCLYFLAPGKKYAVRQVLPGTLAALVSWLAFSILYALYVEHAGNYSVLYGALGTVIVLLLWLYFGSMVLILGAEVNGVCLEMEEEMRALQQPASRWRYFWQGRAACRHKKC